MPVSPDEVRRMAALSRLAMADAEVEGVRAALDGILRHVDALPVADESPELCLDGLSAAPLRADLGPPDMLLLPPGAMAPAWEQGFYVVPVLASHARADPEQGAPPPVTPGVSVDELPHDVLTIAPSSDPNPPTAVDVTSQSTAVSMDAPAAQALAVSADAPAAHSPAGSADDARAAAGEVEWIDVLRPEDGIPGEDGR
jgi:Asp-tRNA(Asn)/Glu-tRNA(Gln) amidotransferase C subunit